MVTFDYYLPKDCPKCPDCGKTASNWQGKHGPNLMLIWEEGKGMPNGALLGIPTHERAKMLLPESFVITAECCSTWWIGRGATKDGVWVKSTYETHTRLVVAAPSAMGGEAKRAQPQQERPSSARSRERLPERRMRLLKISDPLKREVDTLMQTGLDITEAVRQTAQSKRHLFTTASDEIARLLCDSE